MPLGGVDAAGIGRVDPAELPFGVPAPNRDRQDIEHGFQGGLLCFRSRGGLGHSRKGGSVVVGFPLTIGDIHSPQHKYRGGSSRTPDRPPRKLHQTNAIGQPGHNTKVAIVAAQVFESPPHLDRRVSIERRNKAIKTGRARAAQGFGQPIRLVVVPVRRPHRPSAGYRVQHGSDSPKVLLHPARLPRRPIPVESQEDQPAAQSRQDTAYKGPFPRGLTGAIWRRQHLDEPEHQDERQESGQPQGCRRQPRTSGGPVLTRHGFHNAKLKQEDNRSTSRLTTTGSRL